MASSSQRLPNSSSLKRSFQTVPWMSYSKYKPSTSLTRRDRVAYCSSANLYSSFGFDPLSQLLVSRQFLGNIAMPVDFRDKSSLKRFSQVEVCSIRNPSFSTLDTEGGHMRLSFRLRSQPFPL
jgi:hypothetical protein